MHKYLKQNLYYLGLRDPALATYIENLIPDGRLEVALSRSGMPTLKVRCGDGDVIPLHSLYNPQDEARKFIQINLRRDSEAYLLSGFGLGYEAVEMVKNAPPDSWLLFVEADEQIFRTAVEYVDLRMVFSRPRTSFFVGQDFPKYIAWLKSIMYENNINQLTIITYHPCIRVVPEFYKNVIDETNILMRKRGVELNTLIGLGRRMEQNAILNLPANVHAYGVRDFLDKFNGIPAIIVAAGPSLDHNLHLLKGLKNRAVIICVGKSLKLLLESEIVPEFTTHLDMTRGCKKYFEDLPDNINTILLYDPDSYFEIPENYPGPRMTFDVPVPVNLWAEKFLGKKGAMEKSLSVAHTAFYFARLSGADPIILVGVDLAIPSGQTHAKGVCMTWGGNVKEDDPHICYVDGINGQKVLSLKNLQTFITTFEIEFTKTKATVINTSQIGALLRGAINMSLEEAIEKYLTSEYPIEKIIYEALSSKGEFNREVFLSECKMLEGELDEVEKLCQEGLMYLRRLERLDPTLRFDKQKIDKILPKFNKAIARINSQSRVEFLLRRLMTKSAIMIKELNWQLRAIRGKDPKKEMRIELSKGRIFFEGYIDCIKFFRQIYFQMKQKTFNL